MRRRSVWLAAFLTVVVTASAMLVLDADAARSIGTVDATLSGADEVPPGSGDPDGTGNAFLDFLKKRRRDGTTIYIVCFLIDWTNITEPVTDGHIHVGTTGTEGKRAFTLFGSATSPQDGCRRISRRLAARIRNAPANYYINIHNSEFPNGAIRGQLGP